MLKFYRFFISHAKHTLCYLQDPNNTTSEMSVNTDDSTSSLFIHQLFHSKHLLVSGKLLCCNWTHNTNSLWYTGKYNKLDLISIVVSENQNLFRTSIFLVRNFSNAYTRHQSVTDNHHSGYFLVVLYNLWISFASCMVTCTDMAIGFSFTDQFSIVTKG